jgi:citrate synthase
MTDSAEARLDETKAWWRTALTEVSATAIRVRGYAIEDLIGRVGFTEMLWLLIHGELPTSAQNHLLEAALLGGVVHGPHAPSIAVARMAVTCGVGINQAIAQGAAVLGDVHGGAAEQCMELLEALPDAPASDADIGAALAAWMSRNGKFVPGFGHRFHKDGDPRSPRLLGVADIACANGVISGRYVARARALERVLTARKGRLIPMNLDCAAGAVFLELGFAPAVGRGLIVLARSLGILANVWEEVGQGGRLKGPVPRTVGYLYTGPAPRPVPEQFTDRIKPDSL